MKNSDSQIGLLYLNFKYMNVLIPMITPYLLTHQKPKQKSFQEIGQPVSTDFLIAFCEETLTSVCNRWFINVTVWKAGKCPIRKGDKDF